MRLITDNGIPRWQAASGTSHVARRRDQFYNALKTNAARERLLAVELGAVCSPRQFIDACEAAWKLPGLSALQTVDEIQSLLTAY